MHRTKINWNKKISGQKNQALYIEKKNRNHKSNKKWTSESSTIASSFSFPRISSATKQN